MDNELWTFHVATGYPVMAAKKLLAEMAPFFGNASCWRSRSARPASES